MKVAFGTTLNTFGNHLEIRFAENGYAMCDNAWKQDNIKIPFSRFFYITKGEGEIVYDGNLIKLLPNNLYFIPFDCKISTDCKSYMEKFYVHFNIPYFGKLDLFDEFAEILCFPCENTNEMIELFKNPTLANTAKLKSMIFADAVKVIEKSKLFDKPLLHYSELIENAIQFIDKNITSGLKVKDVSDALFVSESHLSKRFSHEIGISMGKYMTNKLVLEVKFCLINTEMTTEEICEKFAFCDRSYYIRFFRSKTGMTPHRFKKTAIFKTFEKSTDRRKLIWN